MSDELERARQRRERRQNPGRAGAFGGLSGAKKAAATSVIFKVEAAQARRENRDPTAHFAGQVPTPERITMALNLCNLHGPEVDEALGGYEPMVDEWESGTRIPSVADMQALAELTGYPVRFFYQPPPPSLSGGYVCGTDGCRDLGGED